MRLVVGLGNPGDKYKLNRHNYGFLVAEGYHCQYASSFTPWKKSVKFLAELSRGSLPQEPVLLLKPLTYMNDSGVSVARGVDYYGLGSDQLLVIHDDLDLPYGELRLQRDRGAAGHHGVESVIRNLGGKRTFSRLRLGIGKPSSRLEGETYVLDDFSASEQQDLPKMVGMAIRSIDLWLINSPLASSL